MVYDILTTFLVAFYTTLIQPTFIAFYNAVLTQELFTGMAWFDGALWAIGAAGAATLFVFLDNAGLFQPGSDKHVITWWSIPESLGVKSYYVFAFIFVSLFYCALVWWVL